MKKILLIIILLMTPYAFSMQETQQLYTKAMVTPKSSKWIKSCYPDNFQLYGKNAETPIKQKMLGQEDLHMTLPKTTVYQGNMYNDPSRIEKRLLTIYDHICGKEFFVTGLDRDFQNFAVAKVAPSSPLPNGVLPENPHISLLRNGNPVVRQEFLERVDLRRLKEEPIYFDEIVVEGEIVKKYQTGKKGQKAEAVSKKPLKISVDAHKYNQYKE